MSAAAAVTTPPRTKVKIDKQGEGSPAKKARTDNGQESVSKINEWMAANRPVPPTPCAPRAHRPAQGFSGRVRKMGPLGDEPSRTPMAAAAAAADSGVTPSPPAVAQTPTPPPSPIPFMLESSTPPPQGAAAAEREAASSPLSFRQGASASAPSQAAPAAPRARVKVAEVSEFVHSKRFEKDAKIHSFIPRVDGKVFEVILLGSGEFKDAYVLAPGQEAFRAGVDNGALVLKVYKDTPRGAHYLEKCTKLQMHQSKLLQGPGVVTIDNDPLVDGYFVCRLVKPGFDLTKILGECNAVKSKAEFDSLSPLHKSVLDQLKRFVMLSIKYNTPIDFGRIDNLNFMMDERGVLQLIDFFEMDSDYAPDVVKAVLGNQDGDGVPSLKNKNNVVTISRNCQFTYDFLTSDITQARYPDAYETFVVESPFNKKPFEVRMDLS